MPCGIHLAFPDEARRIARLFSPSHARLWNNHEHEEAKSFSHERFKENVSVGVVILRACGHYAGLRAAEGSTRTAAERPEGLRQKGQGASQGRTPAGGTRKTKGRQARKAAGLINRRASRAGSVRGVAARAFAKTFRRERAARNFPRRHLSPQSMPLQKRWP